MAKWVYDIPGPNPKVTKLAERNRKLISEGTRQRIGKPAGNNDQRKKIEGSLLPVTRRSIVGRGF